MPPEIPCTYFTHNLCRSCALLDLAPAERARRIEVTLRNAVESALPGPVEISPLWSPAEIFPSRVKAKLLVGGSVFHPCIGFVTGERALTQLLDCPLHPPRVNMLLHFLAERIIPGFRLTPYDILSRRGELKGLIITCRHDLSEMMLRFVLRTSEAVPRIRKALPELQQAFPELRVISVNFQPLHAAIVEGPHEQVLTEHSTITEIYPTCTVHLAPQSFVQVTHASAAALYREAAAHVQGLKLTSALDLFCGVGGFLYSCAPYIRTGIGVESSPTAIACADLAREKNSAFHLSFKALAVEAFLKDFSGPAPDLVIANPPRRGLGSDICARLSTLGPRLLLYSSCNVETLIRDLKSLSSNYAVRTLKPFDMFPLTAHVEVLAVLEARGAYPCA